MQPLLDTEWSPLRPLLLLPSPTEGRSPQSRGADFPKVIIPSKTLLGTAGLAPLLSSETVTTPAPQEAVSDPLNSPHPIPWNWILETHEAFQASPHAEPRQYRSVSVVSPDGNFAAYSRIEMSANEQFSGSQVSSVMFLEDLKTGELQTITAASPLSGSSRAMGDPTTGTFSILIPVSWSQKGDRLLARQFEGLLSTSIASDYGVIWDRATQQTQTCAPNGPDYSSAILLGWSTTHPDQVLFRVGTLGEDPWLLWRVAQDETTILAAGDQPIVFGQLQSTAWGGAQISWS